MEYREIVAVTGLGGLYQLLATKSDGAIVRNLSDKSTKFISARLHNVTPLESIEVYTTGDNVRLHEVFQQMKEKEGSISIIDTKKADNNAVKAYFKSVYPTFDEDRVYVSDMKKMVKWYELLKSNDLLNFENLVAPQAEEAQDAAPDAETSEEEKPAKKATKAKKAATEEETSGEEKPAKKVTKAKKAAEPTAEGEEKPKKTAKKKKVEDE
ncbi:MAG: hypothetical protein EOP56_00145 [Sphingobacteriales bacterium]|nr:MAG: hypothetical protein EOP56_00145 [Sphingobacteriales bacterium]